MAIENGGKVAGAGDAGAAGAGAAGDAGKGAGEGAAAGSGDAGSAGSGDGQSKEPEKTKDGSGSKSDTKEPGSSKSLLSEAEGGSDKKDGKDGDGKDGQSQGQNQGAPEKYADFSLPEGMTLDKGLLEKALPLFKELNLSQEQSQKIVSLQAEHAKASVEAVIKSAEAERTKIVEGFKTETIKKLSEGGADWKKEMSFAAKALGTFGTPELRKLLDETGLSNKHEIISAWIKVGKEMAEDGHLKGNIAPNEDAEEARLRSQFPTMFNSDGSRKPEFKRR
jgi:hypothetical protein